MESMIIWNVLVDIATVIALILVAVQIGLQRKEQRINSLTVLFDEWDDEKHRKARKYIYNAEYPILSYSDLNRDGKESKKAKKQVEMILAHMERVCYRLKINQISEYDAYIQFRDVLLAVALKLWPYIKEERNNRNEYKLKEPRYRRSFEFYFRKWTIRYMIEEQDLELSEELSTDKIFNEVNEHPFIRIRGIKGARQICKRLGDL